MFHFINFQIEDERISNSISKFRNVAVLNSFIIIHRIERNTQEIIFSEYAIPHPEIVSF